MRVLLANYRYFVSGGPERYMFSVSEALTGRGHEVIPFSIDYERNLPSPYSSYFVAPLGGRDEVYYRDHRHTARAFFRTLSRTFYARDVKRAVGKLVADSRPDVAYVLHYLRKLSPSLLVGLKQSGVPIVVRLSDYGMLCPQAHFLRNATPCQLCIGGNILPSIRHRCVHASIAASVVNAAATWLHRFRRYFNLIDRFVVTNGFMRQTMLSAGYPADRLTLIPTFVNTDTFRPLPPTEKQRYVAFAGRLESIKGVHVLVEAAGELRRVRPDVRWIFRIAGEGDPGYVEALKHRAQALRVDDEIEFTGPLEAEGVASFLSRARLQVIPSLWYENLPNALLESYASGTPVVVSAIGSLNDAVTEGVTGYRFAPGSPRALADRLAEAWDHPDHVERMSLTVRRVAEEDYSRHQHVVALENLFADLTARAGRAPTMRRANVA